MSDSPGALNGVNSPIAAPATPTPALPNAPTTLRTSTGDSQKALSFLLVFLGGVVVLIAIGVSGKRYFARRRQAAPPPPPRRQHDGRPALWDVWLDDGGTQPEALAADSRWEDIMPIAAWTDPTPPSRASPAPGVLAPSSVPLPYAVEHHIMLSQSWFRGVYPLEHPSASSSPRLPAPAPDSKMHVAVLVQMPDAGRRARAPEKEDVQMGQSGELVFGLAHVPCLAAAQGRGEESAGVSRNRLVQLQWMPGLRHDNI